MKKSCIKDRSGVSRLPPTIESPQFLHLSAENKILSDKILHDENVIKSLKADYENSVLDCEETHEEKQRLERDLQSLINVKTEPKYNSETSD